MPIIEMKAFEARFDEDRTADELIRRLTAVVADVCGQDVADETWVVLEGVSPKHWGFGGERRI